MSEAFITKLDELEAEFLRKDEQFEYKVNYQAFRAFKYIVSRDTFDGAWKLSDTYKVHKMIIESRNADDPIDKTGKGIPDRLSSNDAFRVNVSLSYLFKELLKNEAAKNYLRITSWPTVNVHVRPNLALNKDEYPLSEIGGFEHLLRNLLAHKVTRRTRYEELCAYTIFRLIAIDGILIGDADINITRLQRKDFITTESIKWIALGVGLPANDLLKQYPITEGTAAALKLLISKAKAQGEKTHIFPHSWRKAINKKKTQRRLMLEYYLESLAWNKGKPILQGKKLDIKWWVQMSRQSMELAGVPYYVIANMRNILRAAMLDFTYKKSDKASNPRLNELMPSLVYDLYLKLKGVYKAQIRHKKSVITNRKLQVSLQHLIVKYPLPVVIQPIWKQYFDWFIWEIMATDKKTRTVSTLYTYPSTLANRALPLIDKGDLTLLTSSDWRDLRLAIANRVGYKNQSKTNALSQLNSLQNYIKMIKGRKPLSSAEKGSVKVARGIARSHIVFSTEFYGWLKLTQVNSAEWIAMFLAFHLGLRCEEIFYLRKQDFEDMERLPVHKSKTKSGLRVIPLSLLLDANAEKELRQFLNGIKNSKQRLLHAFSNISEPKDLSTKVARTMKKSGVPQCKLHMLRHSFASIIFLKYNMLIDPDLKEYLSKVIPTISADVLQGHQMRQTASIFGGVKWEHEFETKGVCQPRPADLLVLSMLMGHASRATTIENYCNSFFWLQRYWVQRREKQLIGSL